MLRTGSRGAAVRALQGRLAGRGAAIGADGIFGPMTGAAVRSFQQSSGLQVDGIVGPRTWRRLLGGGGGGRRQVPPEARAAYRQHKALAGRLTRQRIEIAGKLEAAALLVTGASASGSSASRIVQEEKAPPPPATAYSWLDDAEEWLEEQAENVGAGADWVEEQIDEATEWVEEQADELSGWAEEQVDDAIDWVEEQVDEGVDWVEEQTGSASDWVQEQVDAATDWTGEQAEAVAEEIQEWMADPTAKAKEIFQALEEQFSELHDDALRKLGEIRDAAGGAADDLLDRLEDILDGLDRPVGFGVDFGDVSAALDSIAAELQAVAGAGKGELKAGPSKTEINVKSGTRKVSAPSIRKLGDKLGGSAGWVEEKPTQISFAFDPDDDEKKVLQAELAFDITKTLPDWQEVSEQSPEDIKKYQRFLAALDNHEEGHVSRYRDGLTGLHEKLLGLPESEADVKYDAVRDAADAANVEYDDETNHGLDQSPSTRIE